MVRAFHVANCEPVPTVEKHSRQPLTPEMRRPEKCRISVTIGIADGAG